MAEEDNSTSWYKSFAAGLASGIIKIPEGIVSLGAELIDLGMDTDKAADVEEFFDKLNPFEEVAEDRLIGKLTEAIVQIAVPGGVGFKVANSAARKLTANALKARRANAYANFGSERKVFGEVAKRFGVKPGTLIRKKGSTPDKEKLREALTKVRNLNSKAKYPRYAAAITGGAAGETLVVDNEEIGTFGDMFEGPTELDRGESVGRDDAARKLMNRIKFGSESLLVTPFAFGAGKTAKLLAKRGKDLAYSNSQFQRAIDKYIRAPFTPRGKLTQEIFESEMKKQGLKVRDQRRASQIVRNITKVIDGIFPTALEASDKSAKGQKLKFFNDVNDLLIGGDLTKGVDEVKLGKILDDLKLKKLPPKRLENLRDSLNAGRTELNNLIDILARTTEGAGKKATQEFKDLFKKRLAGYSSNTFEIFRSKSNIFSAFRRYQPTDEVFTTAQKVFAKSTGATENEARQIIDEILDQAYRVKDPSNLPDFKYTTKTMQDGTLKPVIREVGLDLGSPGSAEEKRALRELFGEIKDPRFTLFNSMTALSSRARTANYFDEISRKNEAVQNAGGRGFFWDSEAAARIGVDFKNTGIEVVPMKDVIGDINAAKNLVNPLSTKYTTREIAEGIRSANDVVSGLQAFVRGTKDMTGSEAAVSWFYRNLLLFPKGISQMSKTIFSIPTHIRNFMSAGAFAAANGLIPFFLENPKLLGKAFAEGIDVSGLLKLGPGSSRAQIAYQDLLELGVTNSQVQMGDLISLLKDTNAGSTMMNINGPLSKMLNAIKKTGEFFQSKYVAEDDTFKITNYVVELERLKARGAKRAGVSLDKFRKQLDEGIIKTGPNKGVIDRSSELWKLKTEAANIVKNTVPNYAYVGDVVKTARLLPIGNFMSFPAEIIRTTTNIAERGLKEMSHELGEGAIRVKGSNLTPTVTEILRDGSERVVKNSAYVDGSFGTGFKRLAGMATTLTAVPIAVTEGAKALYDVTSEEIDAMRRFVPEWSKNSTIVPLRLDDGELRYIDFSKSNAYDVIARPYRTIVNNLIEGDKDSETILQSFSEGVMEASGEIMDPFISESIFTEAMFDLAVRRGRTVDGRQLYTDQTSAGDKLAIQMQHLSNALLPNLKPYQRIGGAAFGKVDPSGQALEIGPELAGYMGLRPIKVNPLRSMSFKIAGYQRGIREARREFTGGFFGLLKGGEKSPEDVIERYIASNKARFNVQKEMYKDIEAAKLLDTSVSSLAREFRDRQISPKVFGQLSNGRFDPYYPSLDIIRKFQEIARNIGEDNPFLSAQGDVNAIRNAIRKLALDQRFVAGFATGGHVEGIEPALTTFADALPIINQIDQDLENLDLDDEFNIQVSDYITIQPELPTPPIPLQVASAEPNAQVITQGQQVVNQGLSAQNPGLTRTENALYSDAEKEIALRNRGIKNA